MKKLMALLLAVAMLFCLASCGGDKDGKTNAKKDSLAVCLASEPDTIDPALNSSVDGATMVAHLFRALLSGLRIPRVTSRSLPTQRPSCPRAKSTMTAPSPIPTLSETV